MNNLCLAAERTSRGWHACTSGYMTTIGSGEASQPQPSLELAPSRCLNSQNLTRTLATNATSLRGRPERSRCPVSRRLVGGAAHVDGDGLCRPLAQLVLQALRHAREVIVVDRLETKRTVHLRNEEEARHGASCDVNMMMSTKGHVARRERAGCEPGTRAYACTDTRRAG